MPPRIAIPVPHSGDREYAERSLPQYERAVEMAGGEPVRIPLDQPPAEVMKLIERCDAVLLPGSKADVDPAKYDAPRDPQTSSPDAGRDTVDELLLQDAYNMRKPILGICYGLQILNVYRTGTLIQHIESPVKHAAGRKVAVAHTVEVEPGSKLQRIVRAGGEGHGFSRGAPTAKKRASAVPPRLQKRGLQPLRGSRSSSRSIPVTTRRRTLSGMGCGWSRGLRKTASSKRSRGHRRITLCLRCSGIQSAQSMRTNRRERFSALWSTPPESDTRN